MVEVAPLRMRLGNEPAPEWNRGAGIPPVQTNGYHDANTRSSKARRPWPVAAFLLGAYVTVAYRIETTGVNLELIGESEPGRSPLLPHRTHTSSWRSATAQMTERERARAHRHARSR